MSTPHKPWPDQNGRIALVAGAVVAAAVAMAAAGAKAKRKARHHL